MPAWFDRSTEPFTLCFQQVIQRHFWLKKGEICSQIEEWIADMEVNSSDKRTGRTISHSLVALKVREL